MTSIGVRPIPETHTHRSIADALRQEIADGTLAPDQQLPTLAELRRRFGVAHNTASRAVSILVVEGLVVSKPGARSRVRPRPAIIRLTRDWYSQPGAGSPWRAAMAAVGREGSWRSKSKRVPASPAVAERLGIAAGDRVMRTSYTYLADGEPAYLAVSWEPLALTEGTDITDPEDGPHAGAGVRDRMETIGHTPDRVRELPRAHTLTEDEARELGLHAGMAVVLIERTYLEGGRPVETADLILPDHIVAVYEGPLA